MLVCVSTTPLHTRPRVQRAPGIPCALFSSRGADIVFKPRALRAARSRSRIQCKTRHCEPTGPREARPDDRLRDLSAVARRAKAEAIHPSAYEVTTDSFASLAMTALFQL